MPINFFETELEKIRKRFNNTFGKTAVCDLQLRSEVILSICHLGIMERKIRQAVNKNDARPIIKSFMKSKEIITELFDRFETERREKDAYQGCQTSKPKRHQKERPKRKATHA